MVIAYHSNAGDIAPLRRACRRFDTARNGYLNYDEFRAVLFTHGVKDEDEIRTVFAGVDLDQSDRIMYTQFLGATLEALGKLRKEQMLEAFDRLDADADGTISKRDLRGLLGNHLQDHGVEKMVDDADCAQCGKVQLEPFLQHLSHGIGTAPGRER